MKSKSGLTRKILRVLGRGPVLTGYASLCLLECLFKTSRSEVMQRWTRRMLKNIPVEVSVTGPIPDRGLIAANHVSYLDILVFSAIARCVFVSKSEIKSWPLIGWVAALTGTVFVDRARRAQTHAVKPQMQQRLECGECLVLFPEATSTDGRELLPFRSALFEAAAVTATPVTAAHISYELPAGDGDPVTDVCYWGEMTLVPHLLKLLTKTGVRATLVFAQTSKVFQERKQAAFETQLEVARLGNASHPPAELQQRPAAQAFGEHFAAN